MGGSIYPGTFTTMNREPLETSLCGSWCHPGLGLVLTNRQPASALHLDDRNCFHFKFLTAFLG